VAPPLGRTVDGGFDQPVCDSATTCDWSHEHPLQFGASIGLDADRHGSDGERLPDGEVEGGVVRGVVVGEGAQLRLQLWLFGDWVDAGPAANPFDVVVEQCRRLVPVCVGRRPVDRDVAVAPHIDLFETARRSDQLRTGQMAVCGPVKRGATATVRRV
jgi:hypothetical protein